MVAQIKYINYKGNRKGKEFDNLREAEAYAILTGGITKANYGNFRQRSSKVNVFYITKLMESKDVEY